MVRLTKLEIRKFDGVEPTTLTFGPGFNVLLGKNATGKTTLLEIIAAILRDHFEPLTHRSQEFEIAYELSTDAGPISVQLEVREPTFAIDQVLDFDTPLAWREVRVSGHLADREFDFTSRAAGIVEAASNKLVNLPASLIWLPWLLLAVGDGKSGQRPFPQRVVNREGRLDEALTVWERWFRHDKASNLLRILNVDGHNTAMSGEGAPDALLDAFRDALGSDPSEHPERQIVLEATNVAALREAVGLFDLLNARLTYSVRSSTSAVEGGAPGWLANYSSELSFDSRYGAIIPAEQLSFGQKRMLTFLLYEASTRGTPAVLDELVNGLHYEWVELCVEKLRDRQVFATAQNPLLLDLLGFESVEQVRETFIQCARGADGRMAWTNFSEEQASEFFSAYEVGIQHVHEVLRAKGLW